MFTYSVSVAIFYFLAMSRETSSVRMPDLPEAKRRRLEGADENSASVPEATLDSAPDAMLLRKVYGPGEYGERMYECRRYVWKNKRMDSKIEVDKKFPTRRMALLYVAKMNSDSVLNYAGEVGKEWSQICKSSGVYAVTPNMPFDRDYFLELADDELEKYGEAVGNVLNVHKAPQGAIYRSHPLSLGTVSTEELLKILAS